MAVDVLLGLQWGDEGKGKIVDVLTPKYDVIARFQGGPNAGHTLKFEDTKKYTDRIKEAQKKTNLHDAVRTAVGKSMGKDLVIAAMDFSFIGGSMGSVVGEKIARAIDYSIKKKIPFLSLI